MDVERLLKNIAAICTTHPHLSEVPHALLRILDAFDAMGKRKWYLDYSEHSELWYVADGRGNVIVESMGTPLAALLVAAEQLQ